MEKEIAKVAKVTVSRVGPNLKETANYLVEDGDLSKLAGMGRISGGVMETTLMETDDEVKEVAPGVVRTHLNTERVLTELISSGPVPKSITASSKEAGISLFWGLPWWADVAVILGLLTVMAVVAMAMIKIFA